MVLFQCLQVNSEFSFIHEINDDDTKWDQHLGYNPVKVVSLFPRSVTDTVLSEQKKLK